MHDPIVECVKELIDERSQRGIQKYGTTLARQDVDFLGWIQHLQEELLDAVCYIERVKQECEGQRDETEWLEELNRGYARDR